MIRQAITSDAKYPDATLEVVDVATGTLHRADVDPQMFAYEYLEEGNVWWSNNNTKAWLVEVDRGNREERLVGIDLRDGHSKVQYCRDSGLSLEKKCHQRWAWQHSQHRGAVLGPGGALVFREGWLGTPVPL